MKLWKKMKENGNMKAMQRLFTAISLAVFTLTACQEEKTEGPGDHDNYFASVETFSPDTKTALGEGNSVVWSAEDCIAVFEDSSEGQAYQILDSYIGKNSGEFSLVEGLTANGTTAVDGAIAVYPFNENLNVRSSENAGYEITGINFPKEQRYSAGSFSDEAFPMAAFAPAGSKSLSFKNIGGILKLSLTGSYSVSRINLTGNSGEPISGSAIVTLGQDGIPSVKLSNDACASVTLICDPAIQLDTEKATDFYISVPPTDFEAGFTVTVTDSEGRNTIRNTDKPNAVKRSGILAMPEFAQNALVLMNNVSDSNWDLILSDLNQTALCFSYAETGSNELQAIMDGEHEIRMHFDDSGRPVSYYSDNMEVHIEYEESKAVYYFIIDGISSIDTASIINYPQVKSGTEGNIDFAIHIAGSKEWEMLWNKVSEKIETPFDGHVGDFIEAMNFLKATDGMESLAMAEYTESDDDLAKFIDLIKTKSTHRQNNDFIRYPVGIKAGGAKINEGQGVSFELQGTIKGYSNGKAFNFEYGMCYSATNEKPTFNDSVVSTVYVGNEGQTSVAIALPEWFEVSGLSEEKYYYRAFFKNRDTGEIFYSLNTEILEIADDEEARWVDLGLSVLWAAYNVGASSPEEYGTYFSWGEVEEKAEYTWNNYIFHNWSTNEYYFIGSEISGTSYDAASVKWGGGARMPTLDEIQELENECTFSRGISTLNGVAGQLITGPNGNSIFLPFAGRRYSIPTNPSLNIYDVGTVGVFWSGTFREQSKYYYGAYTLTTGYPSLSSQSDRYHGHPIRPVKSK